MDNAKPHPVVRAIVALVLVTFFGGGLLVFVNLFIPFLNEAAFSIIALILLAEFLVLFFVGKCMQVLSALPSSSHKPSTAARPVPDDDDRRP